MTNLFYLAKLDLQIHLYWVLYIYAGNNDTVVPLKNQEAVQLIYEEYDIGYEVLIAEDVGHVFSTGTPSTAVKFLYDRLGYKNEIEFASDGDSASLGSEVIFD